MIHLLWLIDCSTKPILIIWEVKVHIQSWLEYSCGVIGYPNLWRSTFCTRVWLSTRMPVGMSSLFDPPLHYQPWSGVSLLRTSAYACWFGKNVIGDPAITNCVEYWCKKGSNCVKSVQSLVCTYQCKRSSNPYVALPIVECHRVTWCMHHELYAVIAFVAVSKHTVQYLEGSTEILWANIQYMYCP